MTTAPATATVSAIATDPIDTTDYAAVYTRKVVADAFRAAAVHADALAKMVEGENFPEIHLVMVGPKAVTLSTALYQLQTRVMQANW